MTDDAPRAKTLQEALERLTTVVANEATDRVEAQIPGIVALLEGAGVDVLVLKGPVTRRRLYGPDERRPVADIDVLVDPSAFGRAGRALVRAGYRRVDRHGHSDAFAPAADGDADVDLHLTLPYVTVGPRRAYRVFRAHRSTLDVAGSTVPVLDVPAHVVHLAIHAAVNRFGTDHRSQDEWRRGHERLDAAEEAEARAVASALGVAPLWDVAVRTLAPGADLDALAAERPLWEAEPRVRSIRRYVRSGTPLRVKWRDLERLVALQLSDATLNEWRVRRGRPRLEPGTWRIRAEKPVRLVAVAVAGLGRFVGIGTDPARRSADPSTGDGA